MTSLPSHPLSQGVLLASSPHPSVSESLSAAFGRLIGSWDLVMTRYKSSSSASSSVEDEPLVIEGEWHFGWVLNGQAMQDVWIVPKRASPVSRQDVSFTSSDILNQGHWTPISDGQGETGQYDADNFLEYGTTIRFFVPSENTFRAVWAGPRQNKNYLFTAQAAERDDGSRELEMLGMEKEDGKERLMKWCLTGITDDMFEWREWICDGVVDNGRWWLREEFKCTRVKNQHDNFLFC